VSNDLLIVLFTLVVVAGFAAWTWRVHLNRMRSTPKPDDSEIARQERELRSAAHDV
jgi:hypothetical protein